MTQATTEVQTPPNEQLANLRRALRNGALPLPDVLRMLEQEAGGEDQVDYSFRASDHMSMALAVLKQLKDELGDGHTPLAYDESTFWVYRDGWWRELRPPDVHRKIAHINQWAVPEGKQDVFPVSKGFVQSVYALVEIEADECGFFSDVPSGIAFSNGFVQVDEHGITLSEHSPQHKQRHAHDFEYDEQAECPRWLRFLDEVFQHDKDREEKKRFLAQFLGASLTGQAAVHNRAVMLIGGGANGKSVLCDVVENLFPAKAVSSIPPHVMNNPNRVHVLSGALLNIVTDIPTKEMKDAGGFKQVISGDPIEGRRLYQNPFRFRPVAGHIFSANELPMAQDHSSGFFRRWVVLDFNSRFDPSVAVPRDELVSELLSERPGIMRWAMEGAYDLAEHKGLFIPQSHERNIEGWRRHSNQAQAFRVDIIEDEFKPSVDNPGVSSQRLYDAYCDWAEKCGKGRVAKQELCRRLSAMDVPNRRTSAGREWGVRLRMGREMQDYSSSADEAEDEQEREDIG